MSRPVVWNLLGALLLLAMLVPVAAQAQQRESRPSTNLWSLGVEWGAGVRYLPDNRVPDNNAMRLDLAVWELRRAMPSLYEVRGAPVRLDLQTDWVYRRLTRAGTTSPRRPICVYATWLHPLKAEHSQLVLRPRGSIRRDIARNLALSPGLYTELGRDAIVLDEQLVYRPGATIALAGRVGVERVSSRAGAVTTGLYLRAAAGTMLSSDPEHPGASSYGRLGLETSVSWGPHTGSAR